MAAKKTLAHRWLPGIATAALLSAVASAAAAPPAAAARHSPAAISASQPPGYQVVSSGLVNAPHGTSSSGGFATCPAGTVVWGGGVAFSHANGPSLTVNTSSPNGSSGWEGWVNNTGDTTLQFSVDAICADKPTGYKIVSREVSSPPNTQSHATAACPAPDALLGGGALATADQAADVLTSAWPMTSSAKFTGYLDNGTASQANLIVDAVCGRKPAGYKIVSNGGPVPPGATALDSIVCPAGTSPLDGGAQAPSHVPAVQISDTINQGAPSGWFIAVNNTGQAAHQVNGYAICAA
jgi:hypothetical protein